MNKRIVAAAMVVTLGVGSISTLDAYAKNNQGQNQQFNTTTNTKICDDPAYGTNKTDVTGSHKTITITADPGYLIDAYCVKAGSVNQGLGAEYTKLATPVATVTISHSSCKDISHYSYHQVAIVVPPVVPPVIPPVTPPVTPPTTPGTTTPTPTPTTSSTPAPQVKTDTAELPANLPYTGGSSTLATIITLSGLAAGTVAISTIARKVLARRVI